MHIIYLMGVVKNIVGKKLK